MSIQSAAISPANRANSSGSGGGNLGLPSLGIPPASRGIGDILACGFAMTVGTWLAAYVTLMPLVNAPAGVTVGAMIAVVFAGGFLAARHSARGFRAALFSGALSGVVDMLLIGALIGEVTGGKVTPAIIGLWCAGSILGGTVIAGLGGILGSLLPSPRRANVQWGAIFGLVLVAATLSLISIGGLVTAFRAGLAVPDWPQSYGHNMFAFSLADMKSQQGKFYEHSHRLVGSLVGLTTLTLAIYLTAARFPRKVKWLAWALFACVCIQGALGGTRVVETSVPLAIAHGIFAQLVFASMACLAVISAQGFYAPPAARPFHRFDRILSTALLALLVLQLLLGALLRQQFDAALIPHITAAAAVALAATACGFRAWGLHGNQKALRNVGLGLLACVGVQLVLGVIALALRPPAGGQPTTAGALLTTAHQTNGAILMALAAILFLFTWRRRIADKENQGPGLIAIPAT